MMRLPALGLQIRCLLLFGFLAQPWELLYAQDTIHYIGRSSCASATCHGGIVGRGPAWNSSLSVWEAHDAAHAGAGNLLLNQQSRGIVARLLRTSTSIDTQVGAIPREDSTNLSEDAIQAVLKERCASCHAPTATTATVSWRQGLQEGVSCEACHGPASIWLTLHVLNEPDINELASSGKIATERWHERTENCVRCHVGSRTADGMIRDMNHDMIAAGHPALWFDMSQYHLAMPSHWNLEHSQTLMKNSTQFEIATTSELVEGKQQTLVAAARLSLERQQASTAGQAPFPELAEYDCFACHQSLTPTRQIIDEAAGIAWNHFHSIEPLHDKFPLGDAQFTAGLKQVIEKAQRERTPKISLFEAMRSAADKPITLRSGPNWQLALNWLSTNEIMLLNARPRAGNQDSSDAYLSIEDSAALTGLLERYRSQLDTPTKPGTPKPQFMNLAIGPEQVDFEELVRIREEFKDRISTIISHADTAPVAGANP